MCHFPVNFQRGGGFVKGKGAGVDPKPEIRLPEIRIPKSFPIALKKASDNRLLTRVFGFRASDFGLRISAFGVRISACGRRCSASGVRLSDFGFRISDFGFHAAWISTVSAA